MGFQQAVDRGLGDEIALASVKGTASSRGVSSGRSSASRRSGADVIGDTIPHAVWPRAAVVQRLGPTSHDTDHTSR